MTDLFEDFLNENVIHTFTEKDGSMVLTPYHVDQAIFGDTDSIGLRLDHLFDDDSDPEVVVEFADRVGKEANEMFPEYITKVFNCPSDRSTTIKTDREVVADRSFFLTKKRYAMHGIDKEGKRKEFWKIMGLEIKKSDTPAALKAFLDEMVKDITMGESFENVSTKIEIFKEKYFRMSIKDIGRPMPTKSLKKYRDAYLLSNDMKGFPYHVRAALFYNSLCGPRDREIRVGDKFHLCYIKHPKSKYIGVPVDLEEPPAFVKQIPIDYMAQWKTAEKKIVNYLSSLGWDSQGRKNTKAKSLFGI